MKTLGLIGGTSWHSTVEYYKYINQTVNDHFGDNTNPPLMLFTLNQALVYKRQEEGKWDLIADMITEAALRLEKAGAEQLMLCANTPHKVYELVTKRISTPILHIGDATAAAIKSEKLKGGLFFRDKVFHDRRFCDQANIPARYRRLSAAKS